MNYLAASGLDVVYSSIGDWSTSQELIHQWCIDDGAEVCCYDYDPFLSRPSKHRRIDLAFSPDANQLLCSRDDCLTVWNVPSPESRCLVVTDEDCSYPVLPIYSPGVFDWSPVNNVVAFGSHKGVLSFVDIAAGETLFEEQISQTAIQQVRFSQTGEFLAVFSGDLTVEIWRVI